ncbi:hypothetical protein PR202_gb00089 [Eleusine coracana subsp. coracana]|uniref:Reverse transcriptase zinc-binding domain-containing protein n=1 Tax=Eleusine coracana subsp. coracana TaxID=191504 RepID=A0AAV5DT70_ELECO|nr:hypothetical protein PR202_gb00089 [Eleusine coracana subsp. coracana]
MRDILNLFAAASGLYTNLTKCTFSPIRCSQEDLAIVNNTFPCKYLGIPLSIHKLTKAQLQPLVDKVANRLPTWKSGLINRPGRVALAKSTLAVIPVHISIAIGLPPWVFRALDKIIKGFVWCGTSSASGGNCVVAWDKVCRPTELGGLGIPNLRLQGRALRLRWNWLRRTDHDTTWVDLPEKQDAAVTQFFAASVIAEVGDGQRTLFWTDNWLRGKSIAQLAPAIFNGVPARTRNTRTVAEGLNGETWIRDIAGTRTFQLIRKFLALVDELQAIHLDPDQRDRLIWRWSSSREYTAASAYQAFFIGQVGAAGARELRPARAPPKVKFFIWLALLDRCWTNVRRHRYGLQQNDECSFCSQLQEIVGHLLLGCPFSREVWFKLLRNTVSQRLTPYSEAQLADWWCSSRKQLPKDRRKQFDSLVLLVSWELWKERNRRVFHQQGKVNITDRTGGSSAVNRAKFILSWARSPEG